MDGGKTLDSFNAHCPFHREGHIREEYKSLSATRITLSCFKRIEDTGRRDTVELTQKAEIRKVYPLLWPAPAFIC